MLRPTLYVLPLFLLTFACDKSSGSAGTSASASASPAATPSSTAVTVKSATAVTSASAAPSASAPAPAAKATACVALEWDKDGDNAKDTSLEGKIGNGEGSNATGTMEKFQTIILDKAVCASDKSAVTEIQLYTNEKSIDLKKMVGKHVTIEGSPFSSHTAHHHTPIVVEVKKLTAD